MEQGEFYEICGIVASVCMVLGYLPQAIQTIRTRNTDGIALPTFLMMAIGAFSFMLQGLLHKPEIIWSLFLTNLITSTCSCIVFGIKISINVGKSFFRISTIFIAMSTVGTLNTKFILPFVYSIEPFTFPIAER